MTTEKKQEFKARIIQANRSELIVILYEMMFAYFNDAKMDMEKQEWEEVKIDLSRAESILIRLQDDLNHKYEISANLYALYEFCKRRIAMARIKKDLTCLEPAQKVLDNLFVGMQGMAKEDDSLPMMHKTQTVMAGMTYSKNSINETLDQVSNRGFYA